MKRKVNFLFVLSLFISNGYNGKHFFWLFVKIDWTSVGSGYGFVLGLVTVLFWVKFGSRSGSRWGYRSGCCVGQGNVQSKQ